MSGLSSMFKWTAAIVAVIYVVTLGVWAIGHYGLFGSASYPRAEEFLATLGLPWSEWFDDPQMSIASPAFTVVALWLVSRTLARAD